jgi:RNA polymerase sigma-70 factor (ECF subfamily)
MADGLLADCKAGDERAWERLFRERAGQVYRWAVTLGLSPASAEDAAQEVLATAARRIDTCRSEQALSAWLFQITRRVVANHRRLAWWRRILPVDDSQLEPAFVTRPGQSREQELTVRACLRRMRPQEVELLLLAYVEGFSKVEVARTLGVPPGTAATRMRAARRHFQELWRNAAGAAEESTPRGRDRE